MNKKHEHEWEIDTLETCICATCDKTLGELEAELETANKRIEKLKKAGNELDGLLVTIMQQEYVTGTLPFTDHGRSFASSAHDQWQSALESTDA